MAFKNCAMHEAAKVAKSLSGKRHGKKVLVAVNMTSQDLAAAGIGELGAAVGSLAPSLLTYPKRLRHAHRHSMHVPYRPGSSED
jgi:hypothetical protein